MKKVINKIKFCIRKNHIIKSALSKPVRLIRKYKNYFKSKNEYTKLVDELSCADRGRRIVFYFCAAIHPNLGDLAQRLCIENWLSKNYADYDVVEIPTMCFLWYKNETLFKLEKFIKKSDIFVFQSGYTMSDMHPDNDVRKSVLSRFKDNSCLIFPQTVLYNDPIRLNEIKSTLEQRETLLLLARDEISYKYVCENFMKIRTALYPDIVTTLIGQHDFSKNSRTGIGMCIRNDGEKYYSDGEINSLASQLSKYGKVEITDTNCEALSKVNHDEIEKVVLNKIKSFAQYQVIVTDRYHGTIFSLIAGTPVIVIKTNDHKVSSGVNWFKGIYDDYAYYCDSLEEVPGTIDRIMNKKLSHQLTPCFKEVYYDKLKAEFEQLRG